MKPHSYSDEGIVLARRNYGEADRILSVYTKNHGRVSLIAKGVRKPESRKRGHVEIFSRIRFQAAKGRNLDVLTEVEFIDPFREVRKSLKKVSLAYYFCEVVGRTTREGEPHQEIFDLLLEFLGRLKTETKLKKLRLGFVLRLLVLLGFWPKGKPLLDPDLLLSDLTEHNFNSVRVGKKMVT